jgi:hypothetical protein
MRYISILFSSYLRNSMENSEDFKGGGSSIANLKNTQQHPAQHKQQMMQQPPQGQPIPRQQMQQQPTPQQMRQMQQPSHPIPSIQKTESFMDTIKKQQWREIGKSLGITILLFWIFTNPELIKKIFKSLPFDKQTKNINRSIFAILVIIISFVVTIINKFVLHI